MTEHYMFDVETIDVESTAAVLSAAIIKFEMDEIPVWDDLLRRSLFVKFNAKEQMLKYKRTAEKTTMEWWSKQCDLVKARSFVPGIYDLDADIALDQIRGYAHLSIDSSKNRDKIFWSRGCLDQLVIDSLSKAVGHDLLVPYNNWRDVRTAIDLICEDGSNGYCKVPNFDSGIVLKHDPIHDCAYDLMMLLSNNMRRV